MEQVRRAIRLLFTHYITLLPLSFKLFCAGISTRAMDANLSKHSTAKFTMIFFPPCKLTCVAGFLLRRIGEIQSPPHKVHQTFVAIYDIVADGVRADGLEVFAGTVNLGFFNFPQLEGVHAAFRFCDKVDVLDIALAE